DHHLEYQDTTIPVRLDTFVNYGLAFKERFVPNLCRSNVLNVEKTSKGFILTLNSGEFIKARKVVVAVGIRYFRHLPFCLQSLSAEFVTHSSDHHDLQCFKNQDVVVVGAGASAIDVAALLQDSGANVQLIARERVVQFHSAGAERSLLRRLRHPSSGI